MFVEDCNGYINFPENNKDICVVDSGKTMVYLCVFGANQGGLKASRMENVNLFSPGIFVADDVVSRPNINISSITLDKLIDSHTEQDNYDSLYFPSYFDGSKEVWKKQMSINMVSVLLLGWSNQSFEYRNDIKLWNATYKDLTTDGIDLYYSMKKLYNSKEIRLLTFNTN